jgi:hypothetical protein
MANMPNPKSNTMNLARWGGHLQNTNPRHMPRGWFCENEFRTSLGNDSHTQVKE